MLITLFIGNGFDLNNGLQTTFTDFYNHIKSTKSEYDIRKNDIYSCIEKDRDKWSYVEAHSKNIKEQDATRRRTIILSPFPILIHWI